MFAVAPRHVDRWENCKKYSHPDLIRFVELMRATWMIMWRNVQQLVRT